MTDFFRKGLEALERGDLAAALTAFDSCEEGDPRALSLRGSVLAKLGRRAEAETSFRKAMEAQSDEEMYFLNFAAFLVEQNRIEEAEETAAQATTIASRSAMGERVLAVAEALCRAGLWRSAAEAYNDARRFGSLPPQQGKRAALAFARAGDTATALEILDAFFAAGMADRDVFEIGATILASEKNWLRLESVACEWAAREPGENKPLHLWAQSLFELGRYGEAVDVYERAVLLFPDDTAVLAAHGGYCLAAQRIARAAEVYNRAVEIEPENVEVLCGLARIATYKGETETAAGYCRKSIEINPEYIQAFSILSGVVDGAFNEAEIAKLQALSKKEFSHPEHKATVEFALADAYGARKDAGTAFRHYEMANQALYDNAQRHGFGYDHDNELRQYEQIAALFSSPLQFGAEPKLSASPIFVIGMPRSGTTLLESIIAAHSCAAGGGEMQEAPMFLSELLKEAAGGGRSTADILSERAPEFQSRYRHAAAAAGAEGALVDKQPMNFKAVGMIRAVFPESPIIHIRRSPLEVGYSIYRRNFSKYWPFSNDLRQIGQFYALYARYMAFWNKIHSDRILNIQYEDLVQNFEENARRIISFCGFEWEPACAAPERVERDVVTFSAVQVRRPVSAGPSFKGAESVRKFLAPLAETLAGEGVDIDTGALTRAL